jgi:3alpha(or 20beta)-hydroxysteroid dehydrogenase
MVGRLQDKIAIVTGASRGQGEATARLFAAEGARVVVADVSDAGAAVAKDLGDAGMFVRLDVSKQADWQTLIDAVKQRWGGVDVLVNNAGVVHPAAMLELTQADFERVLGINLIGAWLGIKAVAPLMIERGAGSIVNIASTSGLTGLNGLTAYTCSKWAMRGLNKTAAMELGFKGIRVNAVFPGGINTPMGNITNEPVAELAKYYVGQPIQRIGEPEEVAKASLFLASSDASYICGAELAVDGGQTVGLYTPFLPGAPNNLALSYA